MCSLPSGEGWDLNSEWEVPVFIMKDRYAWNILDKKMSQDSELSYAHRDGRLLELIDETWQKDKLPNDEISVPEFELPAVDDSDHNGTTESLKEQEQKWTDLGIQQLQESPHHTGN